MSGSGPLKLVPQSGTSGEKALTGAAVMVMPKAHPTPATHPAAECAGTAALQAQWPPVTSAKTPVRPAAHKSSGAMTTIVKQSAAPITGRPRTV